MDYDYSKRGYLLPQGCKDLIDVIKGVGPVNEFKITQQADGFIVTFKIAELRAGDIDIVIEGRNLRIFRTAKASGKTPRESVIAVPPGYDLARALATYTGDILRIFVPKY